MCGSLASLSRLVENLEALETVHKHHAKVNREVAPRMLREQIRIIRTELRSMRNVLASKSKHDPERYRMENHVSQIERDLRIKKWELKQITV